MRRRREAPADRRGPAAAHALHCRLAGRHHALRDGARRVRRGRHHAARRAARRALVVALTPETAASLASAAVLIVAHDGVGGLRRDGAQDRRAPSSHRDRAPHHACRCSGRDGSTRGSSSSSIAARTCCARCCGCRRRPTVTSTRPRRSSCSSPRAATAGCSSRRSRCGCTARCASGCATRGS